MTPGCVLVPFAVWGRGESSLFSSGRLGRWGAVNGRNEGACLEGGMVCMCARSYLCLCM